MATVPMDYHPGPIPDGTNTDGRRYTTYHGGLQLRESEGDDPKHLEHLRGDLPGADEGHPLRSRKKGQMVGQPHPLSRDEVAQTSRKGHGGGGRVGVAGAICIGTPPSSTDLGSKTPPQTLEEAVEVMELRGRREDQPQGE